MNKVPNGGELESDIFSRMMLSRSWKSLEQFYGVFSFAFAFAFAF